MRYLFSLFSIIIFSHLLSSCGEAKPDRVSIYEEVTLDLNQGEKWKVPPIMKIYMDSSISLVESFKNTTSIPKNVHQDLLRQKNGFVSNCSMKGEGHDVLHAWLIPYIGLLEDLEIAQTKEEKDQIIWDLENAARLYKEYFN